MSHKAERHKSFWATLHLVCSDLNGHLYDIATKSVMMAPIFPLKNETPSSANDVSLPAPRGSLSFESHRSGPAHFAVMSAQCVRSVAGLCFQASIYFPPFGPGDRQSSSSQYHETCASKCQSLRLGNQVSTRDSIPALADCYFPSGYSPCFIWRPIHFLEPT